MFARTKTTLIATAAMLALATLGSQSEARSEYWTPSGLLLGVYTVQDFRHGGLRVTGVMPGYPSNGVLRRGDVLFRAATAFDVYSIRSHQQIERAKAWIGQGEPTAIEFFRPGVGVRHAWVTFVPARQLGIPTSDPNAAATEWQPEGTFGSARLRFETFDRNPAHRPLRQEAGGSQHGGLPDPSSLFRP